MYRKAVSDPGLSGGGGGGARNMRYKATRMAAIFFSLVLTGTGGGMAPLPPWIRSWKVKGT